MKQVEISNETINALVNFGKSLNSAAIRFANAFNALKPTFETIARIAQEFHDSMYQRYLDAGAVYGETPEGFDRWFNELMELAKRENEIREIRQRQDDLKGWRELGKRIALES